MVNVINMKFAKMELCRPGSYLILSHPPIACLFKLCLRIEFKELRCFSDIVNGVWVYVDAEQKCMPEKDVPCDHACENCPKDQEFIQTIPFVSEIIDSTERFMDPWKRR